jgi:serine O-acetyltransferase
MLKNMREYLTSVFLRDPAARSVFELLTVYPGVHALAFHRLSHRLGLRLSGWPGARPAAWLTGIEIIRAKLGGVYRSWNGRRSVKRPN